MSLRAMNLVGERSRAGKNDLLLLLKVADHCDDEGRNCWMETPAMGRWLRGSERGAQVVLGRLHRLREVDIEVNDTGREIILRGGRRFLPKWFIHVRCVCAWDEYQQEGESADFADSSKRLLRGRPRRKPAKDADSEPAKIRKVFAGNPHEPADKSAKNGSAYKEGSLKDPLVDSAASAEALRNAWNSETTWPLKPIDELTPKRLRLVADALVDREVDHWRAIFKRVEASTFLRGGGARGFIARFEWVLDFANAIHIFEGQYDDHFSEAELHAAASALSAATLGRCPHTPDCRSRDECVKRYALKLRARARTA